MITVIYAITDILLQSEEKFNRKLLEKADFINKNGIFRPFAGYKTSLKKMLTYKLKSGNIFSPQKMVNVSNGLT